MSLAPPIDHPAPAGSPLPTAVVAFVGAGQLARMTHQAAISLGVEVRVLAERADDPAVLAGAPHVVASPSSLEDLLHLAAGADVLTLDHERVPPGHLAHLGRRGVVLRPSAEAATMGSDKLHSRQRLAAGGFPVPQFCAAASGDASAVEDFASSHGWPVVVKARAGGYDGRGVAVVEAPEDLRRLPAWGNTWLIEEAVPIAAEIAVVSARSPTGEMATYPVFETVQRDGICRELLAPARVPAPLAARAVELARAVAERIDAVGILAVELFVTGAGELVVNELALRPHNSGHATIEYATTSQFENHLRAVLGWPLGATTPTAPAAATVNLLGDATGDDPARHLSRALAVSGAHVHLYGKAPRPGRKLGHVTALAADTETALGTAREAASRLFAAGL